MALAKKGTIWHSRLLYLEKEGFKHVLFQGFYVNWLSDTSELECDMQMLRKMLQKNDL